VAVNESSTFPLSMEFNPKADLYLQPHEIAKESTLVITASCEESPTGKSYEESIDFKMYKYPYQIQLVSDKEYLKPKINHTVGIRITSPNNNKPISDADEIQIQYVGLDKEKHRWAEILRNPSKGEFLYTFSVEDSHHLERVISLIVTYKELNQTFDLKVSPKNYFEKYLLTSINQSLSSSSIPTEGKEACLVIHKTFGLDGLNIIGLSNGNIVYNNYLSRSDLDLCGYSIPIKILRRVAPFMTFVAYTVHTLDEFIVSDVSKIYVQQAARVGVDLTLSTLKSRPGHNVTISVKGLSDSAIGLRAVDKSVLREDELDEDDDFSETRLISAGSRLEGKRVVPDPAFKGDNTEKDMMSCGLVLITNVKKGRENEKKMWEEDEERRKTKVAAVSDESFYCKALGWIKYSWFCVPPKKPDLMPSRQDEEREAYEFDTTEPPAADPPQQKKRIKNNLPDTWIWEDVELSEDGLVTIEKSVPPSINSWTFSAFQVNQIERHF